MGDLKEINIEMYTYEYIRGFLISRSARYMIIYKMYDIL